MGSDRARVSYDESRQYRSVVMQQGRVTLEADWNETEQIINEEQRKEALDFVGPAGTPDDGYRVVETGVIPTPLFDFTVSRGTMYVGGERAYLPSDILYSQQPDWLDYSADPTWVNPVSLRRRPTHESIYLLLREQEVGAVEDTVLREVSLGGPDTAQRTRLLQHIVRIPTEASDCQSGQELMVRQWEAEGLTADFDNMRLLSSSTLQITFPASKKKIDPCEPVATGGYLGADNQLIRVQISSVDQNGNYRFLWGYDDASFLYRVQCLDSQNLKLQSRPVDQYHQPRSGQAVEVLRSAAFLGANNYIASPTGLVFTLTSPYDPDQQTVTLPSALDPVYQSANDTPTVFLRVWEEQMTVVPGTAMDLGQTGMQVTLAASGGQFHVGDFWLIAVRPSTPTEVYPHRFREGPQPPDGPRLWFCPLAVIEWNGGILHVLEDCRNAFDNLVELTKRKLGGCCTVTVHPEDVRREKSLQRILDRYADQDKIVVCLMPGVYELREPLRLGKQHSNLTLEACHDGAVLKAAKGAERAFLDGLIVLVEANNVTLRGLRFDLPQVPFAAAGGRLTQVDKASLETLRVSLLDEFFVSIGVRPVHSAMLAIERCLFRFSRTQNRDVLGIGVFAGSECWGFRLTECRFVGDARFLRQATRPLNIFVGYLLSPTVSDPKTATNSAVGMIAYTRSLLQDARIEQNYFTGLSAAGLVMAQTGAVGIERNTVRECYSGFWLLSLAYAAQATNLHRVLVTAASAPAAQMLYSHLSANAQDPLFVVLQTLATTYPLPREFDAGNAVGVAPKTVKAQRSPAQSASYWQNVFDKAVSVYRGNAAAADVKTDVETDAKTEAKTEVRTEVRKKTQKAVRTSKTNPKLTNLKLVNLAAAVSTAALGTRSPLAEFDALRNAIGLVERTVLPAAIGGSRMALTLGFINNDIDLSVAGTPNDAGLTVVDDDRETDSHVLLSANTVRNSAPSGPTVLILMADRCAVTGNIVVNDAADPKTPEASSLVLFPGGHGMLLTGVAVTGNVFKGRAALPARPTPVPPPMNNWNFFNAE